MNAIIAIGKRMGVLPAFICGNRKGISYVTAYALSVILVLFYQRLFFLFFEKITVLKISIPLVNNTAINIVRLLSSPV